MSADPYMPIACAFHERLEFAVLRRARLNLTYRDMNGEHTARVRPTDVATRDGAEWMTFVTDDGAERVVRLDRIVRADPIPNLG